MKKIGKIAIYTIFPTKKLFFFSTPEEIALIKAMFDEARAMAIVEKDTVKVSVSNHRVDLIGKENKTLNLEQGYTFLTNHTFTFNDHGHIKIAKTLVLKTPHHTKKFVFQLGSGAYHVA